MSQSSLEADGSAAGWFCELMKDLAASYPNFRANERQTRVYATALQDLAPEQVRNAMGRAIMESKFFPSVAELRQYVDSSPDDRAQRAWLLLRRAVEEVGAWRSLLIDDPYAAEALRRVSGSWHAFCEVPDGPDVHVLRQGFLSSYRDAQRQPMEIRPVRMAGLCESSAASVLENDQLTARLTNQGTIEPAYHPQLTGRDTKQLPPGNDSV